MEICFVPDNDYGRFLQQAKLVQKHRGEIVNLQGQVLGQHDGIEFYTIGQRQRPGHLVSEAALRDRTGRGEQPGHRRRRLRRWIRDEFIARALQLDCVRDAAGPSRSRVKIRYNHPGALATMSPLPGGTAQVKLHTPQRAITAGQAAVFYQDDLVVGGGWIARL